MNNEVNAYTLSCEVRNIHSESTEYLDAREALIEYSFKEVKTDDIKKEYEVTIRNINPSDFEGVIHIKVKAKAANPKFFMPGYMYNRNTADMPCSGRKAFPRIRLKPERKPESEFFMTRSDRLAEPVSLVYEEGRIFGISAAPMILDSIGNKQYSGFSCNINDGGFVSAGYTLGYENAPWLFVQTANVYDRADVTSDNSFVLKAGEAVSLALYIYDYEAVGETDIYKAIEDTYYRYHESPRKIKGMNSDKAISLLKAAIRDYAWLPEEKIYSGFVYDKPEGIDYNKIPSISWTNGLAVAVPMLLCANRQGDEMAREQSLSFIEHMLNTQVNEKTGFLYESQDEQGPTVKGWWYDGMHSGGHSSYINGQAAYYLLKAYMDEKQKKHICHDKWVEAVGRIVERVNRELNSDWEYPFSMSVNTGAGLEYDSMGGAWCLVATAMYELVTGDNSYMENIEKSELHYFEHFVKKAECYGGPLDTDKAVDSEGILAYIRASKVMHELTGKEMYLDHLKAALDYEFSFKLGYNTHITVRPLSEIGWSSCGGSITSVANPHIHPMSSTVIGEMKYYLSFRDDKYVKDRFEDTIGWSLQTFNTKDKEYGYGKPGWMSERFCFCQGLLVEKYPDGETASTWFALMPWASASILEGLVCVE